MATNSQISGDGEECSSCESGWTMYLTSPMHSYHGEDESEVECVDDGYYGDKHNRKSNQKGSEGDEDYDSMASDASSGAIQRKVSTKNDDACGRVEKYEDGRGSSYTYEKCNQEKKGRKGDGSFSQKKDGIVTSFYKNLKLRKKK